MANLIIQENGVERTTPALHGEEITIQTPCDCSAVSGVQIAGVAYPFYDAAGKVLPSGTGLFTENSLIRVLIDTENTRATIINHAITPASIGARPSTWMPTAADVGAVSTTAGWGEALIRHSCEDWDTMSGTIAQYMKSTAASKPNGIDHCMWQVAYNDSWKMQFACDYRTDTVYIRSCANGTWGSWKRLLTAGDQLGYGTTDLTAGTSSLPTGAIYLMYE